MGGTLLQRARAGSRFGGRARGDRRERPMGTQCPQEDPRQQKRKGGQELTGVLIRWTFGETKARRTSPQAWGMLRCSLEFAKHLLPEAERVVCYNNLSDATANIISKVARENGANLLDASELLPTNLRNTDTKNSWWKYAPRRLDLERYEIVMDNDVVLWRVPPTLRKGIRESALVALTDAAGQYYG